MTGTIGHLLAEAFFTSVGIFAIWAIFTTLKRNI